MFETPKPVPAHGHAGRDVATPEKGGAASIAPVNAVWGAVATRVQAKLTVSQPDDPLEREADAVADQVMRMADAPAEANPVGVTPARTGGPELQRSCASCAEDERRAEAS